MEPNLDKQIAYERAKKRVKDIKGFYIHLLVFVLVNLMIIFIRLKGDNHIRISQFLTLIVWGVFLIFHFLKVYIPNFILSKDWEENKIKEIMSKKEN